MSNLGLEHALAKEGIEFRRAKVGDRYVLEMLKETGGVLGGETSGHLLCLDRTTTGDALISALQVLAIMKRTGPQPRRAGRADAEVSAGAGERAGARRGSTRPSRRDPGGGGAGRATRWATTGGSCCGRRAPSR